MAERKGLKPDVFADASSYKRNCCDLPFIAVGFQIGKRSPRLQTKRECLAAMVESIFAPADLAGRKLGCLVADCAWSKAQTYFDGTATPSFQQLWTLRE